MQMSAASFLRHGVPNEILSDLGKEFTNLIIDQALAILKVQPLHSSGFRPQTNGQVERRNRTINQIFRMYFGTVVGKWSLLIPFVHFAINNLPLPTVDSSPEYTLTPYSIIYGRLPRDPLDMLWKPVEMTPDSHQAYSKTLRNMLHTLRTTQQIVRDIRAQMMRGFSRSTDTPLKVGDFVLYYRPKIDKDGECPSKWHSKWQGPFKIIERYGEESEEGRC